jgi:hypothetical protein
MVIKPVGPPVLKVSPEADLVTFRLVMILDRCVCFTYFYTPYIILLNMKLYFAVRVLFIDQNIPMNVVRRHRHMW